MYKKIALITLFLILVAGITKLTYNWCAQAYAVSNYELEETQIVESQNLSPLEIINKINQLTDDYNTYIVNHFDEISKKYPKNTEKQDKLYSEYLRKIEYYSNLLNEKLELAMYELSINRANISTIYKDKVGYKFQFDNAQNLNFISGEIFNPHCPELKIIHIGEGYFSTTVNYEYLAEHKNQLGSAMQEYLDLREKEQSVLKNQDLWLDGGYVCASMSTLTDWIVMWQNFLDKNPKFYLKDKIENDIYRYAYYFVAYDFTPSAITMSNESKKAYQNFFNKVKPKSEAAEAYSFVKRCYEMLKMNNYKYSNNNLLIEQMSIYRNKHNIPAMY